MKLKQETHIATLKAVHSEGDQEFYLIAFSPYLPRDPNMKGTAYPLAYFTVVEFQGRKSHKWRQRGVLCASLGSSGPDPTRIHAECDGITTPAVMCKSLGYKFVDEIKNKKQALIERVKSKLDEDEIEALGLK